MDIAVQFLSTVAGSYEDVEGCPKDSPSTTQMRTYTLCTLIRDSARVGRDAGNLCIKVSWNGIIIAFVGFLQLLFLAGATGHPIQQHCNLSGYHDLYKTLIPPCSCAESYRSVVHIMWTNLSQTTGGSLNHIIPLIEKHSPGQLVLFTLKVVIANPIIIIAGDVNINVSRIPIGISCEELEQTCLMWGKCSGSLATQGKKLAIDWVKCMRGITMSAWDYPQNLPLTMTLGSLAVYLLHPKTT